MLREPPAADATVQCLEWSSALVTSINPLSFRSLFNFNVQVERMFNMLTCAHECMCAGMRINMHIWRGVNVTRTETCKIFEHKIIFCVYVGNVFTRF